MRKVNNIQQLPLEEQESDIDSKSCQWLFTRTPPRRLVLILIIILFILISCGMITFIMNNRNKESERLYNELQEEKRLKKERVTKDFTAAAAKNYSSTSINEDLVIYAYYETSSSRLNIVHFIRHGLHAYVDFLFIINGDSNVDELLPQNISNIRVVRHNNYCYDLGTVGEVLRADDHKLVKTYKRFIFMNGSVRGPYLPTYVDGCWSDMFFKKISDEVKLVGTTFNFWAGHIQSMVLATDTIGIKILLAGNGTTDSTIETDKKYINKDHGNPESLIGLNGCPDSKFRAVSTEISLTHLIRRAGYQIAVQMTSATAIQTKEHNASYYAPYNDYNLASVHPYEIIFIKAREGWGGSIDTEYLNRLSEWHDDLDTSSWQTCKPVKT
jgi:hypothetical protein